jgi:hypothetical protein
VTQRQHDHSQVLGARALELPWRTGRRVPRNIYAQVGPEPDHTADVMIGGMDHSDVAAAVVALHNRELGTD